MARYKMVIDLEFETQNELPTISAEGTMDTLESIINGLPQPPTDINDATTHGVISLKKVA